MFAVAAILATTLASTQPHIDLVPVDLPGHFRVDAFAGAATVGSDATISVRVSRTDGALLYTRLVRATQARGSTGPVLDFSIDVSHMPSGVYSIVATVREGAFRTSDGKPLTQVESEPEPFAVAALPSLPRQPFLGQRYIYFPWADDYSTYGPSEAAALEPALSKDRPHELVLTAIEPESGGTRLVLRETKTGQTVRVSLSPSTWLPVKAIVDDPVLEDLRKEYEGKRIWHYAGGWAECPWLEKGNGTGDGLGSPGVRITRIARIYGAAYTVPLGSMPAASMSPFTQPGGFYTWTPIVVFLDTNPISPCIAPSFTMFADRWDFERVFSLVPPAQTVRRIALGMTKDQVAWSIGFPLVYGTRADVLALDTWKYAHLPPFNYWVYFKHGKVVRFGEDGNP